MAVPLPVWRRLGNPGRVSCYFDRWDLIILPSTEMRVDFTKHWARLNVLRTRYACLVDLIKHAHYDATHYRIQDLTGILALRIIECSQFCIDQKSVTHWQNAEDLVED